MKLVLTLAVLLLWVFAANAQTYKYAYGDEVTFDKLSNTPASARSPEDLRHFLGIESGTNVTKAVLFAVGNSGYQSLLQAAEQSRLDKQTGSSPSSSGTTSIVSKGVVPQVLGFAVEKGGLTETDNNTSATFRGTGLGVARLVGGVPQFPYCAISDYDCDTGFKRILNGTSFSVSFNTSQNSQTSNGTPPASNASILSGNANQVSNWTLRYDFHVRRHFSDDAYRKQWQTAIVTPSDAAKQYLASVESIFGQIRTTADYQVWMSKYVRLLSDPRTSNENEFKRILAQAAQELVEIAKRQDSTFSGDAEILLKTLGGYLGARDKALDTVVNRVTYSVEYDNNRPTNQRSQSIVKFVVSGRPSSSETSLVTFNSSTAWYNEAPTMSAVSRFRYGQVALQVDRALTRSGASVAAALSGGYYFQYMTDNSLLNLPSTALAPGTSIPLPGNASVLLNTKGSIHLGQAQVTFSIRGTGIKFPIALSFSNRTELIKATNVVGHFGITYDLDSLFTKK